MLSVNVSIPRADKPEDVGVSSAAIAEYVRDIEKSGIESHSLMIIRHGKVAYESWRKPYEADTPHIMYSVSKSIMAIAAGFAITEGYMTPETRLVDVFPECVPENHDEALEKITLHQLMTMTVGKNVSPLADKTSRHWVRDFMEVRQTFQPGEGWTYVNENTYCVSAMISKLTGMSVTDYLKPRLYEPLGITSYQWERDHTGVETGGWGLYLRTEDLAKIALCCLNDGVYDSKQIIPKEWLDLACSDLTSGISGAPEYGYGYFIWGCDTPDTVRFDGMFSQLAYIYKEYDAVVVLTNNEIIEDKAIECYRRYFPDAFFDNVNPPTVEIPEFTPLKEISPMPGQPETEKKISGRTIKFSSNPVLDAFGFPLSLLTFPTIYMSAVKPGPVDNFRFSFYGDECTMYWAEGKETNIIHIGLDGVPRRSRIRLGRIDYTTSATGAWLDKNTLEIHIRPLESLNKRIFRFTFKGNSVTLRPSSDPDIRYIGEKVLPSVKRMMPSPAAYKIFSKFILNCHKLVDAPLHGKFVDK